MAGNISVRRNGDVSQQQMQPSRGAEWEPWHFMRSLLSWDPFREMGSSLTPYYGGVGGESQLVTAFDVKDTPEAFIFQADVPGLKEKDLDIQLSGNRLSIRGHREAERKEPSHNYYTYERSYGSFARVFTLPESADTEKCTADLKDGVLTVMVPKKASEQPRTIAVNKSQSQKS